MRAPRPALRPAPPPPAPSASDRLTRARRAADRDALAGGLLVDVLVIGAGASGCGVALDAATRGLSVALVEREDLAAGTSRWSSKLIHGGLRYLAGGDVTLAWESARERALLLRHIAPHLVHALPMVVPLTPDVTPAMGLLTDAAHHAASALRRATATPSRLLPPPRRLSVAETRRLLPGLRADRVRGGLLHWDGQLEDDARLVVALARTAAAHGARVLTHTTVTAATGAGADVRDELDHTTYRIRARAVVNATGVWAGRISPAVALRPSKGVHLVLPAAALGRPAAAMTVPVPGEPRRYVFALPQPDDLVYLGLTDDAVTGAPPDRVAAEPADEAFLLATVNRALAVALTPADVVGSFAGMRPLLHGSAGRTADLSRRHAVVEGPEGLWTVVGGKLTTYRRMAEDTVDRLTARPACTATLALVGATGDTDPTATATTTTAAAALPARLVRRYGSEAALVAGLAAAEPALLAPVAPGLPVLGVELAWGVLAEGALTTADLLERRTRLALVAGWAAAATPAAEAALAAGAAGARPQLRSASAS